MQTSARMVTMTTEAERDQTGISDMASLMTGMSDLGIPQYQIRKIGAFFGANTSAEQPEDGKNATADVEILRLKGSADNTSGKENSDVDRIMDPGDAEDKEIFSSQVVQLGMKVGDKVK